MSISPEFSYRVRVKHRDKWSQYDRVRFGISVGMPYHEGDKLHAALCWADRRFRHIDIRVSDALQRYNFPGEPEENKQAAIALGDAWLDRNGPILQQFRHLFVFRWSEILANPDFSAYQQAVRARMDDPAFRAALQSDIDAYRARTGHADEARCLAYLQEELAVFSLLQDHRPAVEAYPGSFLTCRQLLRPDFALVRIGFERVKNDPAEGQDLAA